MRIKNLESVISEIRGYLPEYLELYGRKVDSRKKTFCCPNEKFHKNGDSNPSAGLVPSNPQLWNCFACGEKGDIFLAAHHIEGAELKGSGFIATVTNLAEQFQVKIIQDDDAEEIISALEYVASVIKKGLQAPLVKSYVESRGFEGVADEFGIGFADPKKLYEILRKTYEHDFIERNELSKTKIFDNRMTFPIHDDGGSVVAFAGRTLNNGSPKYFNSSTSIVFLKSKILYNLNRITSDHVYVFEGYADVWTAWSNGIQAVASCGTAFTEDHLNLLIRSGMKSVTFVFDGDDAGHKAMERTLKIIENCLRLDCSYITLSSVDEDPDAFIKKHGKDAFLALEKTIIEEPKRKKRFQFLERLELLEETMLSGEMVGYRTGWARYDQYMENVQNGLHLVGGISNIGKTAWMTHLALNLAETNPDLFVLYVSIDDNLKAQVPRVIANLGTLPVNQVKNPKVFIDQNISLDKKAKEMQWKRRALGNNRLIKLAENNLAIIDINDASRLDEIEREIHIFQQVTGKPVALFLDNFHKIRSSGFNNFRERFTHVSEELKRITSQNSMITFSTVELTKLGHDGRPDHENIKETVDLIYDAETIHMLHSDFHSKQGNTELKFMDGRLPGKHLPILEVNVTKNKISGFKGKLYYKFFTDFMYFDECDAHDQKKYRDVEV